MPEAKPKIPAGEGVSGKGKGEENREKKENHFGRKKEGKSEHAVGTKQKGVGVENRLDSDRCDFDWKLEGHWQRLPPEKRNLDVWKRIGEHDKAAKPKLTDLKGSHREVSSSLDTPMETLRICVLNSDAFNHDEEQDDFAGQDNSTP